MYNQDNMFSEGWKFDYESLGRTGEVETQTCTVVNVLLNEKREVRWVDGTIDPLHVDDIEDCKPAPMFRGTLQVGDEIEYGHDTLTTRA